MKLNVWNHFVACAVFFLFSTIVRAESQTQKETQKETEAVTDVQKLVAITRNISSIKANFKQQIKDQFGNTKDKSSGTFYLKKPFKFIWHTESPFQQKLVSNGDVLWTFDQDLDQVNIESLNKAMGNTPVFFLGASAETLSDSFQVKQLPGDRSDAKTFELQPRVKEYTFERMLVLFKGNALMEILLKDTLGQQTSVEFDAVEVNQGLQDSLFEFVPPEGVDVLDSRTKEPASGEETLSEQ